MDYDEVIDWLYNLGKFGIKLGLNNTTYLMDKFDNPHKKYKVMHVAGTNGKGSVCAMVYSILRAAGYNVGLYTSPHLTEFFERIVVNEKPISKNDVVKFAERIMPTAKEMELSKVVQHPTFFEVVTAMAFNYFAEQKVDFAVIEVGMGGAYDSTNVVSPLVSAITTIDLDHKKILGKTKAKIAEEKAGIIKLNVPVATSAEGKALEVIKNACFRNNCKLSILGENVFVTPHSLDLKKQVFDFKGIFNSYNNLEMSLIGVHQFKNAACALAAIELLKEHSILIDEDAIRNGLKNAKWPGRFEVVQQKPYIILDGAHNPNGMDAFNSTLKSLFPKKKAIFVLSISNDKDYKGMVKLITKVASHVVITKHKVMDRGLDINILNEEVAKYIDAGRITIVDDVVEAVEHAKSLAGNEEIICITGSLFTVGEARELWFKSSEEGWGRELNERP